MISSVDVFGLRQMLPLKHLEGLVMKVGTTQRMPSLTL